MQMFRQLNGLTCVYLLFKRGYLPIDNFHDFFFNLAKFQTFGNIFSSLKPFFVVVFFFSFLHSETRKVFVLSSFESIKYFSKRETFRFLNKFIIVYFLFHQLKSTALSFIRCRCLEYLNVFIYYYAKWVSIQLILFPATSGHFIKGCETIQLSRLLKP